MVLPIRLLALARLQNRVFVSRTVRTPFVQRQTFSTQTADHAASEKVIVSQSTANKTPYADNEKVLTSACGDIDDDDDDEMEQEEMFVQAHESFEHKTAEWGGPRRGGRLPEPTRFGDWERKGRCTDF